MTWHPAQRAECEAEIKQVVAEIEALQPQVGAAITDVAALRRQAGDAD